MKTRSYQSAAEYEAATKRDLAEADVTPLKVTDAEALQRFRRRVHHSRCDRR